MVYGFYISKILPLFVCTMFTISKNKTGRSFSPVCISGFCQFLKNNLCRALAGKPLPLRWKPLPCGADPQACSSGFRRPLSGRPASRICWRWAERHFFAGVSPECPAEHGRYPYVGRGHAAGSGQCRSRSTAFGARVDMPASSSPGGKSSCWRISAILVQLRRVADLLPIWQAVLVGHGTLENP